MTASNDQRERLTFVVGLKSHPPLEITEFSDELDARHLAKELADALGLAVLDSAGGTPVLHEAGSFEQPLREQASRVNFNARLSAPPENTRLTCQIEADRLILTWPREPFDPFLLAYLIAPLIFSCFAVYLLRGPLFADLGQQNRLSFLVIAGCLIGLPPLLGIIGLMGAVDWGGTLEATAAEIRITRHSRWLGRVTEIPTREFDEVRVGKAKGTNWQVGIGGFNVSNDPDSNTLELQLLTKQRIVGLGRGLSREELEWLRDVILRILLA